MNAVTFTKALGTIQASEQEKERLLKDFQAGGNKAAEAERRINALLAQTPMTKPFTNPIERK